VLAQGFLLFVVLRQAQHIIQRHIAARRSFVGGFVAFQVFIFVVSLFLFRENIELHFQTLTSVCIVPPTQKLSGFREKEFCKTGFIFILRLFVVFWENLGFVARTRAWRNWLANAQTQPHKSQPSPSYRTVIHKLSSETETIN